MFVAGFHITAFGEGGDRDSRQPFLAVVESSPWHSNFRPAEVMLVAYSNGEVVTAVPPVSDAGGDDAVNSYKLSRIETAQLDRFRSLALKAAGELKANTFVSLAEGRTDAPEFRVWLSVGEAKSVMWFSGRTMLEDWPLEEFEAVLHDGEHVGKAPVSAVDFLTALRSVAKQEGMPWHPPETAICVFPSTAAKNARSWPDDIPPLIELAPLAETESVYETQRPAPVRIGSLAGRYNEKVRPFLEARFPIRVSESESVLAIPRFPGDTLWWPEVKSSVLGQE